MVGGRFIYLLMVGCVHRFLLYRYRRRIPKLVKEVRRKKSIKVLFVLSDLSLWKTEELYVAMSQHPRFEPILGTALLTSDIASEAIRKYTSLIDYLKKSKYPYLEVCDYNIRKIGADIIFYQQPYNGFVSETISFFRQAAEGSLICDVHYSMRTLAIIPSNKWVIDLELYRYCWQMYVENEITAGFGKLSVVKGKNIRVTGMPIQDVLARPKEFFNDPWIKQDSLKKRIIFAPHHTIPNQDSHLNLSKFLDVADIMISLARKYEDSVQFAFKPHPFLKEKLVDVWGYEKVDDYYRFWEVSTNTQLCEGKYLDLFKYSDAMIHDCDSFTLEYCYVKKPILFLVDKVGVKLREDDLNDFAKMAFELHDKGCDAEAIEGFIQSVVQEADDKKSQREYFYNNYLLPPNHRSAVDNIIDAIISG